jgi:hypothetical protein
MVIVIHANPVIRFDSSWIPSSSTYNGSASFFVQSGTSKTVNMFLIPGLGTSEFAIITFLLL